MHLTACAANRSRGGIQAGFVTGISGEAKVVFKALLASALVNGNYFAAAIAVLAGGVIAIGVKKHVKAIAATMYCTFGKGNQKWCRRRDTAWMR